MFEPDVVMNVMRVNPVLPLTILRENIAPYLNALTIHHLRMTSKEAFNEIPPVNPFNFSKNPYSFCFNEGLTTVLSFEYACNNVCALCQKRYVNGTFDKMFGIYAHNACVKSKLRIFIYSMNDGYKDMGQYCPSQMRYIIKPGKLSLVGFLANGGLLVPRQHPTLTTMLQADEIENQAGRLHLQYFRIVASRERIGKAFFENAFIKFNFNTSFRRIDIGELYCEEIDSILSNYDYDVTEAEQSVISFITEMQSWVGDITARLADLYVKEILPYVYKSEDNFLTWECFWYHGLCIPAHGSNAKRCSGTEYWKMILNKYKTKMGSFDIDQFMNNMKACIPYVNGINFASAELNRQMRRTVLECCECYRCSVVYSSFSMTECKLHLQSSSELQCMLVNPNSEDNQKVIHEYQRAIDQVYDTLALYLDFDRGGVCPRQSIAQFRVYFRELLQGVVLPISYPFDQDMLRRRCKSLAMLMERFSIVDLYRAYVRMKAQSENSRLYLADTIQLHIKATCQLNSRCTCVCGSRTVSNCKLNLCNACCVSRDCQGHRKVVSFLQNDEIMTDTESVEYYSSDDGNYMEE